jgi:hypothetical protein
MEQEKLSNKGWKLLISLIDAGKGMTDAAGKCGHDDELSEWDKSLKQVKKHFGVTSERVQEARKTINDAKELKIKKKEEALELKRKKEAEDLKKELGY